MSATSASANASGSASVEQRVVGSLEPKRGKGIAGETAAADRAPIVAREQDDIIGQLEEPAQARVQQPRLAVRVACDVQVGASDVADQQRVSAEHEPRLLAAPPVGDRVGVMGGRMAGRRDRGSQTCSPARPPRRRRARRARTRRRRPPAGTRSRRSARPAPAAPRRGRPERGSRIPPRSAPRSLPPRRHNRRRDRRAHRRRPTCRGRCSRTGSWHRSPRRSERVAAASVSLLQLATSTAKPARRHSGKPTSNRRAFSPRSLSSRTASSAYTQ